MELSTIFICCCSIGFKFLFSFYRNKLWQVSLFSYKWTIAINAVGKADKELIMCGITRTVSMFVFE